MSIEELEAWHERFPTGEDYARVMEAFEVESYNWDGSGPLRETMQEIARIEQTWQTPPGWVTGEVCK